MLVVVPELQKDWNLLAKVLAAVAGIILNLSGESDSEQRGENMLV